MIVDDLRVFPGDLEGFCDKIGHILADQKVGVDIEGIDFLGKV